jgi:hypothetical protein
MPKRRALRFTEKFNQGGVRVEVSELEPQADMGSAEAKRYVYVLDGDYHLGDAFKTAFTSTKWLTEEENALLRSHTKIALISLAVPEDFDHGETCHADLRRLFFRGYPCRDGMKYADFFQDLLITEIIPAVEGPGFQKIGPANRAIAGHSLSGFGAFTAWLGDSFDHMLGAEIAFPAARQQGLDEEPRPAEEEALATELASANWQALEERVALSLATLRREKVALWTFGKANAETRAIPQAVRGETTSGALAKQVLTSQQKMLAVEVRAMDGNHVSCALPSVAAFLAGLARKKIRKTDKS